MIGTLTLTAYLIGHTADPTSYLGQTMAFTTLSTTQLFHAFNMKSKHSIFNKRLFSNKYLLLAFGLGIALQIGICYIKPFARCLKSFRWNSIICCFALRYPLFRLLLSSSSKQSGCQKAANIKLQFCLIFGEITIILKLGKGRNAAKGGKMKLISYGIGTDPERKITTYKFETCGKVIMLDCGEIS